MRVRRSRLAVVGVAGAAVLLGACGGNTSTDGAGASSAAAGGASASDTSAAGGGIAELGTAAGQKAGAAVALEPLTIGYVNYAKATLAAAREEAGAAEAAAKLGFEFVPCDAQGNPALMATCATNLVNQGVDVLMVNTLPQSALTDALDLAEKNKIPVVNVGGDPGQGDRYVGSYYPSEPDMGTALAEWTVENLGTSAAAPLIVQSFPAPFATQRNDELKKVIAGTPVSIAAQYDADAANLIPNTQSQVSALVNQHPDAKGVWIVFSGADLGASQALDTKFPGKSFPERPGIMTFYANLPTIDLIRQDKVQAAVENSLEWCAWVAMDQVAQWSARNATISPEPRPDYGTGLDFWRPVVVDKTNLPAQGQLMTPPVDYRAFFSAKWSAEFSNLTK